MSRQRIAALWILVSLPLHAAFAPAETRKKIAVAAESQVGRTTIYDPSYVQLKYPGGDLPVVRGVCADVVIRAMRSIDVDLQKEVHVDMSTSFAAYPKMWGLRRPDRNIDHRRVPNLMRFFTRSGKELRRDSAYEPGDIVAWQLPGGLYHIGVVSSDRVRGTTRPYVVHNIGRGAQKEDVLDAWPKLGHYRW